MRGFGENEGNRAVLCVYVQWQGKGRRKQPLESRSADAQGLSGTWTSEPELHQESLGKDLGKV